MWDEFQQDLSDLGPTSEKLLHDLMTKDEEVEVDLLRPEGLRLERVKIAVTPGETEIHAMVKVRRGQHFFRQSVLSAYGVCCCISGINLPELLVASHIKPWGEFPKERLDPSNGLCLSNLHDRAFDSGLITVDKEFKVVLSKRLRDHFTQPALEQNFAPFDRTMIRLPEKLAQPSEDYLRYHRERIFQQ
jgi:putative restriction endonuclease